MLECTFWFNDNSIFFCRNYRVENSATYIERVFVWEEKFLWKKSSKIKTFKYTYQINNMFSIVKFVG